MIPKVSQFVIQDGLPTNGGIIFMLGMDEPVKTVDLAKKLINCHGTRLKKSALSYGGSF
ncbi:polysaccharide biosynthesis protein [Aeribacillus pallidus]|nr:polysaccharide biosynthesis protein [Aeribacillus pallidus]